ncbi:hypothetical protein niasHT_038274 [Heterodera trifolii]|uniref:Uncharacterized protein n=1 Tax=Heterodera trifolii TaxID=157864 RepID=A0ABD2I8S0_9BILA
MTQESESKDGSGGTLSSFDLPAKKQLKRRAAAKMMVMGGLGLAAKVMDKMNNGNESDGSSGGTLASSVPVKKIFGQRGTGPTSSQDKTELTREFIPNCMAKCMNDDGHKDIDYYDDNEEE